MDRRKFNKRHLTDVGKYHNERAKREKKRRYNEIKEKIEQWKNEGYSVDELEGILENVESDEAIVVESDKSNMEKYCSECGRTAFDDAKFCAYCGEKFDDD